MHIDTSGRGSDVVLVHGLPQDPASLEPLAAELARAHRVHLVHLPGYGRSEALPGSVHDLAAVEADLVRSLAERGVRAASYVGFSGGTFRSIRIALREPTRVLSLVLVGPMAQMTAEKRAGNRDLASALEAGVDLVDGLVGGYFGRAFRERDLEAARALVRGVIASAPAAVVASELRAFSDAADVLPALPELRVPSLVVGGEEDAFTPVHDARAIADALPASEFELIAGVGHAPHVEVPTRLADRILDFLRRVDGVA